MQQSRSICLEREKVYAISKQLLSLLYVFQNDANPQRELSHNMHKQLMDYLWSKNDKDNMLKKKRKIGKARERVKKIG